MSVKGKIGNLLFVGIFMFCLLAGLIRTVFWPKDINYYENRYCNKIIAPTKDSVMDGSFQNSMEDALTDQILGAQSLKKIYNKMNSVFSDLVVAPVMNGNTGSYINYKNGIQIFNGYYMFATYELANLKERLQAKAANYNAVFEKHPELDFYVYFIEKDTDINFETGEKIEADAYLFSLLNLQESRKKTFEVNSFEDFSAYFYKTDHHWKHTGSYKGYTQIAELLGCEGELVQKGREVLIGEEFMGSKAATAGAEILKEPFYAYEYAFPTFRQITGPQGSDYGRQEELSVTGELTYGAFYGGDDGEVIFDTGNTERENLLIIGESYDNAVLKLIATHFNKTCSVDLRNYEFYKGCKFDFEAYVQEHRIDKVLFLGNIDFYTLNTFELEG